MVTLYRSMAMNEIHGTCYHGMTRAFSNAITIAINNRQRYYLYCTLIYKKVAFTQGVAVTLMKDHGILTEEKGPVQLTSSVM